MSAEAPLGINNCTKPDIPQPDSGGVYHPESSVFLRDTATMASSVEALPYKLLPGVLSGEIKADRGSRGIRRGRGRRRSRCSQCSGRHSSFSGQCQGGMPGLNQLAGITAKSAS